MGERRARNVRFQGLACEYKILVASKHSHMPDATVYVVLDENSNDRCWAWLLPTFFELLQQARNGTMSPDPRDDRRVSDQVALATWTWAGCANTGTFVTTSCSVRSTSESVALNWRIRVALEQPV